MLKRLYHWTLAKAAHPLAERWLAGVAFAESSFFPIPPDIMLIPMCLARPDRAFRYASICSIASVLGALLGYAIGYFLFAGVGEPILELYGLSGEFAAFSERFNDQGWLIVLVAGFTPLPFKVITIAAGATAMPLHILIFAAIVSRAGRFFLVAGLLWRFGEPMKAVIEKHFGVFTAAVAVVGIGGFFAVEYLF